MDAPQLIESQDAWTGPRWRLQAERWATVDGEVLRPVIRHPGAVAVIAEPEPGRLVLVRQWRYPQRAWTLEVPAGTCDPGEDPAATALRELAEETGWRAERVEPLCRFMVAPGVSDERMTLFRAIGLRPGAPRPDRGELIRAEVVARADLPRALGSLPDAKTLVALAVLGWHGGPGAEAPRA